MSVEGKLNVAFLGFDKVQLSNIYRPREILNNAAIFSGGEYYHTFVVGDNSSFTCEDGVSLSCDYQIFEEPFIDTLVIPGGVGALCSNVRKRYELWLDGQFEFCRRVVFIGSGMIMLGNQKDILSKDSDHALRCFENIEAKLPALKVIPYGVLVKREGSYSSSGIFSGIDWVIDFIEEDFGLDANQDH